MKLGWLAVVVLFLLSLFAASATPQATKINPGTQIRWPGTCTVGTVYSPVTNTCVSVTVNPGTQVNWPVSCTTGTVYAPVTNTCVPSGANPASVLAFGAKCDGVTNDHAALQAALAAADAQNFKLIWPAGQTCYTATALVYHGQSMEGATAGGNSPGTTGISWVKGGPGQDIFYNPDYSTGNHVANQQFTLVRNLGLILDDSIDITVSDPTRGGAANHDRPILQNSFYSPGAVLPSANGYPVAGTGPGYYVGNAGFGFTALASSNSDGLIHWTFENVFVTTTGTAQTLYPLGSGQDKYNHTAAWFFSGSMYHGLIDGYSAYNTTFGIVMSKPADWTVHGIYGASADDNRISNGLIHSAICVVDEFDSINFVNDQTEWTCTNGGGAKDTTNVLAPIMPAAGYIGGYKTGGSIRNQYSEGGWYVCPATITGSLSGGALSGLTLSNLGFGSTCGQNAIPGGTYGFGFTLASAPTVGWNNLSCTTNPNITLTLNSAPDGAKSLTGVAVANAGVGCTLTSGTAPQLQIYAAGNSAQPNGAYMPGQCYNLFQGEELTVIGGNDLEAGGGYECINAIQSTFEDTSNPVISDQSQGLNFVGAHKLPAYNGGGDTITHWRQGFRTISNPYRTPVGEITAEALLSGVVDPLQQYSNVSDYLFGPSDLNNWRNFGGICDQYNSSGFYAPRPCIFQDPTAPITKSYAVTANNYMYPLGQDRIREATPPYTAGINFPLGRSTVVWAVKGTAGLTNSFIARVDNCPLSTADPGVVATFTGAWQLVKLNIYIPNSQAGCTGIRIGSGATPDTNTAPFEIAYMAVVPAMGDIAPTSVATPYFSTVGGQPTLLPLAQSLPPSVVFSPNDSTCIGGNDDPETQYQCVVHDSALHTRAGLLGVFYKKLTAGCKAIVTCPPQPGATSIDIYRPFGGATGAGPGNPFNSYLLATVPWSGGGYTDVGPGAICTGCTQQNIPADTATGLLFVGNTAGGSTVGFTGTKTAGSCVINIVAGIIIGVTGC